MNIERWEPWNRFAEIQQHFNEMLDEFFASFNDKSQPRIPSFSPALDMYKSEKFLVIRAALPGVMEEDIDVTLEKDALVIRGESAPPFDIMEGSRFFNECRYGYFERRIQLPEEYDIQNIDLQYGDGILEIKLARKPRNEE